MPERLKHQDILQPMPERKGLLGFAGQHITLKCVEFDAFRAEAMITRGAGLQTGPHVLTEHVLLDGDVA